MFAYLSEKSVPNKATHVYLVHTIGHMFMIVSNSQSSNEDIPLTILLLISWKECDFFRGQNCVRFHRLVYECCDMKSLKKKKFHGADQGKTKDWTQNQFELWKVTRYLPSQPSVSVFFQIEPKTWEVASSESRFAARDFDATAWVARKRASGSPVAALAPIALKFQRTKILIRYTSRPLEFWALDDQEKCVLL